MRAWRTTGLLPLALALGAGCGAPAKPRPAAPAPPPASDPPPPVAASGPVDPALICAHLFRLRDAGCEPLQSYGLDRGECVEDWRKSLEDRGDSARTASTSVGRCFVDSDTCDALTSCVSTAMNGMGVPDEPTLRTCADTSVYAPVGYPKAEWDARRGANAQHYSEVGSTKDQPIEVCGIPAEMDWLLAAKCDDGSAPFSNADHAHSARVGNVGPGGRCGAIVDLYEVACPEKTYQVFIDAYVCPQP